MWLGGDKLATNQAPDEVRGASPLQTADVPLALPPRSAIGRAVVKCRRVAEARGIARKDCLRIGRCLVWTGSGRTCHAPPRYWADRRRHAVSSECRRMLDVVAPPMKETVVEQGPQASYRGGAAAAAQAEALLNEGRSEQAAAKLREAINLEADPMSDLRYRLNLGCALEKCGQREGVRKVLEDMLRRTRTLYKRAQIPELRQHLDRLQCFAHVNLHLAMPDDPKAQLVHLEKALSFDSSSPQALNAMAFLLEKTGDSPGALSHVDKVLSQMPEELVSLGLKSRCLENLGRHEEALVMCMKICKLDAASIYSALREVFRCRVDDVFVCTYPRCGTTWMVQLVACILYGVQADYNAHAVFLEGQLASDASRLLDIERMPSPRILKTHAPADVFPGLHRCSETELQSGGKTILVLRNPKDVLVSLRHHHQNHQGIAWTGTWDEWIDEWLKGHRSKEYGGTWFAHVRDWWRLHKQHPHRSHVVYYEDMKANFREVAVEVAGFLGKDVSSRDLELIENWCAFDQMKSKYKDDSDEGRINPNHFFKGERGGWRKVLSEEQAQKVDEATWRELAQEISEGLRIHDLAPRCGLIE